MSHRRPPIHGAHAHANRQPVASDPEQATLPTRFMRQRPALPVHTIGGLPEREPDPSPLTRLALIVEDDETSLRFLRAGLKGLHLQGWDLKTARTAQEALEIMATQAVSVLVTDLGMPGMDGFGLIREVHAYYPFVPILVVTSLAPPYHQRAMELGAMEVWKKPVALPRLMEAIVHVGRIRPDAFVRGLSIGSLLQLVAWERESCTMKVRDGRRLGHLYVKDGVLIQAEWEGRRGQEAALNLLCAEQPTIELVTVCRAEAAFQFPVAEALLAAAVRDDHAEQGGFGGA